MEKNIIQTENILEEPGIFSIVLQLFSPAHLGSWVIPKGITSKL